MLDAIRMESEMKLKLTASVMTFSTATIKLISIFKEKSLEMDEDERLLKELENAYMNVSEEEIKELESLDFISFEADQILQRMANNND